MYEVYYAVGGWDAEAEEPVGGFILIDAVDEPARAIEAEVRFAGSMDWRHGPGEVVVIDAEATRRTGRNVRVNPYLEDLRLHYSPALVGAG